MLIASLIAVFVGFCLIMGAVLMFCIRQRRLIDGLEGTVPATAEHAELVASKDKQIIRVLFVAIFAGAVLALVTGYLVFVQTWD